MAPVRAHICPNACVYVSVNNEKKTWFSSFVWGEYVKRLDVPSLPDLIFYYPAVCSRPFLWLSNGARCASQATDSVRSCITVGREMVFNSPEQSHSPKTS